MANVSNSDKVKLAERPVKRAPGKGQRSLVNTHLAALPLAEQPCDAKREVTARKVIDAIKTQIKSGNSDLDKLKETLEEQFSGARIPLPWIGLQRAKARKELGLSEKPEDEEIDIGNKPEKRRGKKEKYIRVFRKRVKEPVTPARIETEAELLSNIVPILHEGVAVGIPIGTPAERAVDADEIIAQFARRLVEKHAWLKLPQFLQTLTNILSRKFPFNGSLDHFGNMKISPYNTKRYAGLDHDAEMAEDREEDVGEGDAENEEKITRIVQGELPPGLAEKLRKDIHELLAIWRRSNQKLIYELIKRNPGVLISTDEISGWVSEILSPNRALGEQGDAEPTDPELRNDVVPVQQSIRSAEDMELFKAIVEKSITYLMSSPDLSEEHLQAELENDLPGQSQKIKEMLPTAILVICEESPSIGMMRAFSTKQIPSAPQASQSAVAQRPPTVKERNIPSREARKKYGAEVISFLNASNENLSAGFKDMATHVNGTFDLKGNARISKGYVYNLYWGRASPELKERRTRALAAKREETKKEGT